MIELRGDQGANTESFYAILIDANFKTWNLLQKFSKIMRDWRKLNLNRKYTSRLFNWRGTSSKAKFVVLPWFMVVNRGLPHEKLTIVDRDSV